MERSAVAGIEMPEPVATHRPAVAICTVQGLTGALDIPMLLSRRFKPVMKVAIRTKEDAILTDSQVRVR